jgi:hypothetical protein
VKSWFTRKLDTAGGVFELSINASQKVGMLTGTVRVIILAQRSVPENRTSAMFAHLRRAAISQFVPRKFA